jgi:DNA-binding transcriptional ArsR family regulator
VDRNALFRALDDETSRAILVQTSSQSRSAAELAEITGVDSSTIYRHAEELTDNDLLQETIEIDPGGDHHKVYRASIRRIEVEIVDEQLTYHVEWREDGADRLTRIWEGIRR